MGLRRRVNALARTVRRQTRLEYYRNQGAYNMNSATAQSFVWCLNEPNQMGLIWNAGAAVPIVDKVFHHSIGLRVFLSVESQIPTQTYVTLFILQGKPALQRYLDGTNELAPVNGTHFITGTSGLTTEGRAPGAMVNKDLFRIVKFKRIRIGQTAFVGQGVTNFDNTHKEFYFKLRPKLKYEAVQGNAMTLTEGQMPVSQRYFLFIASDEAQGDAQPAVWVNWVSINKIDLSN